jgi:Fe-S cluster assembly iron-binding protein IscA
MLELTNNAADVIRSIAERPELPDDAGLRIATDSADANQLTVEAAGQPADGDEVVEQDGARVFLTPPVASLVEDKVLDARVGAEGAVQFSLSMQH